MCAINGMPTSSATSSAMSSGTIPEVPEELAHPHLDADDEVAVGLRNLNGIDRIHQPDLLTLANHDAMRVAVDAGMRDMEIRKNADLARLDHVLAKACEITRPGAAGVDRGGDAGGAAELLGVDADRGAAPINE